MLAVSVQWGKCTANVANSQPRLNCYAPRGLVLIKKCRYPSVTEGTVMTQASNATCQIQLLDSGYSKEARALL